MSKMYRIYIPSLNLDLQHEDVESLHDIIYAIKQDQFVIQQVGWINHENDKLPKVF